MCQAPWRASKVPTSNLNLSSHHAFYSISCDIVSGLSSSSGIPHYKELIHNRPESTYHTPRAAPTS